MRNNDIGYGEKLNNNNKVKKIINIFRYYMNILIYKIYLYILLIYCITHKMYVSGKQQPNKLK